VWPPSTLKFLFGVLEAKQVIFFGLSQHLPWTSHLGSIRFSALDAIFSRTLKMLASAVRNPRSKNKKQNTRNVPPSTLSHRNGRVRYNERRNLTVGTQNFLWIKTTCETIKKPNETRDMVTTVVEQQYAAAAMLTYNMKMKVMRRR
jgi:hypothetical protein